MVDRTEVAKLVLWREQPDEWRMEIASDQRCTVAVDRAVTTMPSDIHAELLHLVTITKEDLAKALARRRARQAGKVTGHGPVLISHQPLTVDSVRAGQIFVRRSELDWLFFARWRLPEEAKESLRALVEKIVLVPVADEDGGTKLAIDLQGALAGLLCLATGRPIHRGVGGTNAKATSGDSRETIDMVEN